MRKVCVIGGHGYVGQSIVNFFKSHENYQVFIKEKELAESNYETAEVGIICVPTPSKRDGSCNLEIVIEALKKTDFPIYLIKSAIPPGTSEKLKEITGKKIVVSPEYIGEGKYIIPYWQGLPHSTDMTKHDFQIFGGDLEDTKFMVNLFSPILGPYCKYFQTDLTTAELVKYMENSFYATKIVFCHEFSRIAETFGVDYNELRELWLTDGRIGRGSTAVFDPNKLGFGGKCLPKDIQAIYHAAKERGFTSKFLNQVIQTNNELNQWGGK